ncbi:glycosyltransferase family 47 protein [Calocera cornea HHB12733]|uniref:Glycosyltransferase family 47 protein n=1 Tax=Calocera cornea HHB12733 TaxID=1353952 RepID=A0A165D6Y3_9BASI|nr:glycosyltransferase family 47 protein [Calocera cornea HHB12733]
MTSDRAGAWGPAAKAPVPRRGPPKKVIGARSHRVFRYGIFGLCLIVGLVFASDFSKFKITVPQWPATLKEKYEMNQLQKPRMQLDNQDAHIVGPVTNGRVVVTGGGGMIGKHLIRRLLGASTPVTAVDLIFNDNELEELYEAQPKARKLLKIVREDIRNPSSLHKALTSDVAGVVHLAAVSRESWCEDNQADCFDVNDGGTQAVLSALDAAKKGGNRPWLVFASDRRVYDSRAPHPVQEDAATNPTSPLGISKLKAEGSIQAHLIGIANSGRGVMHAITLRLSDVYGSVYDHADRLVASIASPAMTHLPVQYINSEHKLDLVHIDDCVDAFLLAMKRLTTLAKDTRRTSPRTTHDIYNVAGVRSATVSQLVDKVLHLTRSKSPILQLESAVQTQGNYQGSIAKAIHGLGFRSKVSLDDGLLRLIGSYLARTEQFLIDRIDQTCYAASPHPEINSRVEKLDGCIVHVSADVSGLLGSLNAYSGHWQVDDDHQATRILATVRWADDSRWMLSLQNSEDKVEFFGLRKGQTDDAKNMHDPVFHSEASEQLIEWELETDAERAAVKLVVPGTEHQLGPPPYFGGEFTWISRSADVFPWRLSPLCCPASEPWPFTAEDPLDHSIEYLRVATEDHFAASIPKSRCDRLSRALEHVGEQLGTLSLGLLDDDLIFRKTKLGPASGWVQAQLPACTNICDHPAVCVDTGDCQCVLSTCSVQKRFPFVAAANSHNVSFSSPGREEQKPDSHHLETRPSIEPWMTILRPQARQYLLSQPPFPNVYVSQFTDSAKQWISEQAKPLHELDEKNCFSADSMMELLVREQSTAQAGQADLYFLPNYQARYDGLWHYAWEALRKNVPSMDPHRLIIPFTHDFGACRSFDFSLWNLRHHARRDPSTRHVIAWSVNGDLNSVCYKPFQDVVIPPRTCNTPELFEKFRNSANVRPASERKTLAAFTGTYWGVGGITRRKVVCNRFQSRQVSPALQSQHELRTVWGSYGPYGTYLEVLEDTIFCPVPEGVAGWSPRLVDAVYAGCIPVFIGQAAQHPFHDMLDWAQFSVTVDRENLQRLERVLLSYTMDEVLEMQRKLMLVREALVYPLDGEAASMGETEERGPEWWAMHASRMRWLTKYPGPGVVDRPDGLL